MWACLIQGLPFTQAVEAEDSNREIHSGLLTSTRLSVLLLAGVDGRGARSGLRKMREVLAGSSGPQARDRGAGGDLTVF